MGSPATRPPPRLWCDSVTVMDPFHVVALAGAKLDLIRQRIQQQTDILAFFDHHASTDPPEAINGRLEALRRNALGFRNLTNDRLRSVLHSGALHQLVNAR
jgi:transposase